MNKLLIIIALIIGFNAYSQDLPTEPENGFAFPLGTKFTIKLYPTDSDKFDYSVIQFEQYHEIIDTWKNDSLFEENTEKNGTIEFYFCLATSGKSEEEKDKNMKVLLIMKNRTVYNLEYNSDIQREEGGEFETTSNIGAYSGAKGTEMWPYIIHHIALSDFKIAK